MKKILSILLILSALSFAAQAQLTSTVYTNCLIGTSINCQTTVSNLAVTLITTNPVWQGRNVGIGVQFGGQASTNTGTIGFQFAVKTRGSGTNGLVTTTRPFTITSTANGVNGVIDYAPLPATTLGPVDALVLVGITNSGLNISGTTTGGVIVSNVWIQYDTLVR